MERRERRRWFEAGLGRLPGGAFGVGEPGRLGQEGAHAVELGAGGGVQPAEAAHPMKAGGQDVLEETPDEFAGLQVEVPWLADGAVPVAPPYASACLLKPRRRQANSELIFTRPLTCILNSTIYASQLPGDARLHVPIVPLHS